MIFLVPIIIIIVLTVFVANIIVVLSWILYKRFTAAIVIYINRGIDDVYFFQIPLKPSNNHTIACYS